MHTNAPYLLVLPVVFESLPRAAAFVEEHLDTIACSMKARAQLSVILDEIPSNIVRYAKTAETSEICFSFDPETRTVHLTFTDDGEPYNPLRHREPDVSLPVEKRQAGGLGIFLVRKLADAVSYEYADGKNILRVDKKI